MTSYIPRYEKITGADCTGTNATTGRTYTLSYDNSIEAQFDIVVEGMPYQLGTHYDLSSGVITFNTILFDAQNIDINYLTTSSTDTSSSLDGGIKHILYENPDVISTSTTTTSTLSYGDIIIPVSDASSFSENDFILVESQGNEYNEIRRILSISSNNITISSAIEYPHISGITITKLNYDQYRIEKSTDGSNYTTLVTSGLDYSNQKNKIEYDDESGKDTYYYKIYYRNSYTDTDTLQDTLHNQDNFSWMTLENFQNQSGLNGTYSGFTEVALRFGVESLRDDIMFVKTLETTDADNEFELDIDDYYLADFNGDRNVNKEDIIVYEYNPVTKLRTYLHHKIVKVFINNPKIVFKESVPTSGSILVIETPVAQVPYTDYKRSYEEINKLYAVNYLLGNKSNESVKDTILSWTAGGTTVNREPTTVNDIIKSNSDRITMLMKDLMLKTYFAKTKLRTKNSSLNLRARGNLNTRRGFSTPTGNWY